MIIYLDSNYICHLENSSGELREIETDAFEGCCKTFVEGYRFIPFGETWTRDDGVVFSGEMVTPIVEYGYLENAQKQYEEDLNQMQDMIDALEILGVT